MSRAPWCGVRRESARVGEGLVGMVAGLAGGPGADGVLEFDEVEFVERAETIRPTCGPVWVRTTSGR